ncbi:MAG: hypothetical protein ACLGGX_11790 [Bdellovibrionia bacterium]
MKKVNGSAVSQKKGALYSGVNQFEAKAACQALGDGFELITNDQWQNIARNIAYNAKNWSYSEPFQGQLSIGFSEGTGFEAPLEAGEDHDGCYGTKRNCTFAVFSSHRRTHILTNEEVIWDFSGNLCEWTSSSNAGLVKNTPNNFLSLIRKHDVIRHFSIEEACDDPENAPYCGYGFLWSAIGPDNKRLKPHLYVTNGGIIRGGCNPRSYLSGVFAANYSFTPDRKFNIVGFRCTYSPPTK